MGGLRSERIQILKAEVHHHLDVKKKNKYISGRRLCRFLGQHLVGDFIVVVMNTKFGLPPNLLLALHSLVIGKLL